ncbi:MAG: AAA family ATPase [Deltaproteobacteria bacterium]|nr:AAA family ATPase [Deltaproteobacteria bacterium]
MTKKNILITGSPGIGKTTLALRVGQELSDLGPVGFITEEIREMGTRKGFSLHSFDGRSGILAHVDQGGGFRVGKYGVDVSGFEKFLDDICFFDSSSGLIILDEIGKMECYSKKFREMVPRLFDDEEKVIVATVARRGGGLIAEVKVRPDVDLFELDRHNRNQMVRAVVSTVRGIIGND